MTLRAVIFALLALSVIALPPTGSAWRWIEPMESGS